MTRRFLALVAALAVLTGCRVDVGVDLQMAQNGSGSVTVTALADAEVVAAAPGLAEDLRLDDLRTAGWAVEGPTATPDGGLQLVVRHGFSTPEQATALLASLNGPGGPFRTLSFARDATDSSITYTLTGSLGVDGGLSAFADADVLAAIGATPYADQIAASGLTADQAVGITLDVALPGSVVGTTGTAPAAGSTGAVRWTVPMDGTRADLATTTRESLDRGGIWSPLATVAFVVLIAWLVLSLVLIVLVAARRRRVRRRPRRVTPSA